MITPNEMIEDIERIKVALNQIEVKGAGNANCLLFAYQKCDALINSIDEIIKSRSLATENQNGAAEVGE